MAYSDNLMTMDPSWIFRNAFPDTWLPDNFSKETETITKALQKSFDTQHFDNLNYFSNDFISPWLNTSDTATTFSNGSTENGNDSVVSVDPVFTKTRLNGKIMKRKSRASKKSTTTFINADVANFRQLVQQVTGGGNGLVVKPEAQRGVSRLQLVGGGGNNGLPMLDTSAFLVDPTYQNNQVGPTSTGAIVDGGSTSSLKFDSFCSFPTLESWKGI